MKAVGFFLAVVFGVGALGYFIFDISGIRGAGGGSSGVQWVEPRKISTQGLVPDFKVKDRSQREFRLSESRKIKVVNLWASWCAPCLEEIPSMAKMAAERNDVEVIAISCDTSAKDFNSALRIFPSFAQSPIRLIFDPDKRIMSAYGVTGFPETFIVSSDNRLLQKITGPVDWQKYEFPEETR